MARLTIAEKSKLAKEFLELSLEVKTKTKRLDELKEIFKAEIQPGNSVEYKSHDGMIVIAHGMQSYIKYNIPEDVRKEYAENGIRYSISVMAK